MQVGNDFVHLKLIAQIGQAMFCAPPIGPLDFLLRHKKPLQGEAGAHLID